jgi:general L-amino acid transport system substrate-binding protein
MRGSFLVLLSGALLVLSAGFAHADVLADVKARGAVLCGASLQPIGVAATLSGASWAGLGADYCRGLAAVIFNDATKVQFRPLAADDRLSALTTGKVDALADPLPWTLSADTGPSIIFAGTLFYDGQGFLVQKASGLRSARDLAGRPICVVTGDAQAALDEYFGANNISARSMPVADLPTAIADYEAGTCLALSADTSVLATTRASLPSPADHVLLPDLINKKPLGLAVRQGDDRWFDIARWTFFALLDAEELGVTQTNVDEMLGSDNISIRRLLGVEGDFGVSIGLNKDWAYQLIKNVGNYADIYDRDVGDPTPMKLPRGLNALWNKGGIQYAPPVR